MREMEGQPSATPSTIVTENLKENGIAIHKQKHKSHISISSQATSNSVQCHKEYLDHLERPSHEMIERINQAQMRKEEETIKKRLDKDGLGLTEDERTRAAGLIQRNYRGHRERRMLAGISLDPSARWVEAIKEAQYRNLLQPRARGDIEGLQKSMDTSAPAMTADDSVARPGSSAARQNWKKIAKVTRRAGGDEDSDSEDSGDDRNLPEHEREESRKRRIAKKLERQKAAKVMDLQYFLEMVDLKHRYGSNLRTYHEEWKKSDTKENFFYWLDCGEGRLIDCQGCPRERLNKECVRYLSKEERMDYLVKITDDGRLAWAKNGILIDTTEKYKDSIHGIVPDTDDTPAYAPPGEEALHDNEHDSSDASSELGEEIARASKYATPEFDEANGMKKVKHVSAATIFNKLLRGSVKKNTWIFVADTSFRLYVGIKQSGAFQHSSFLHGSRISAAGLIKIKNGRLSKLSPLSGHYRPPVKNFRDFEHSLKEAKVDMSHVSISRSFAVLVGLEAYVKTRRRGKKILQKLVHHRDKILSPDELAIREEQARDKSESAEKERRFLEQKQREEETRSDQRLLEKLRIRSRMVGNENGKVVTSTIAPTPKVEKYPDPDIQAAGTRLENSITQEATRDV